MREAKKQEVENGEWLVRERKERRRKWRRREGGKYGCHQRHTQEEGSTETNYTLLFSSHPLCWRAEDNERKASASSEREVSVKVSLQTCFTGVHRCTFRRRRGGGGGGRGGGGGEKKKKKKEEEEELLLLWEEEYKHFVVDDERRPSIKLV